MRIDISDKRLVGKKHELSFVHDQHALGERIESRLDALRNRPPGIELPQRAPEKEVVATESGRPVRTPALSPFCRPVGRQAGFRRRRETRRSKTPRPMPSLQPTPD